MNSQSAVHCCAVALAAALSLAACKNDGDNPVPGDQNAATTAVPGSGAGNSATGATGGTATSPGEYGAPNPVAATPGCMPPVLPLVPGAGALPDQPGTQQPGQTPSTTPSR